MFVRQWGYMNNIEDDRPILDGSEKDLSVIRPLAYQALISGNKPPRLFSQNNSPVRIEVDDRRYACIEPLDIPKMRNELGRCAIWKKNGLVHENSLYPPKTLIEDMLADPICPLPRLSRIVSAPVFSQDGKLETTPGYSEISKNYFHNRNNLIIPEIPVNPSADEIKDLKSLLDDTISDFPFVSNSDKTNAISLFLLPFCRDMIQGATPLYCIEASQAGSGKGLLTDALLYPGTGGNISLTSPTNQDEEMRKRIITLLKEGKEVILLDNFNNIDSPALAACISADTFSDRKLGKNETMSFNVRNIWVTTANNPTFSNEIARRTIRIRLEPATDKPWLRSNFKIDDLREYVKFNRSSFCYAALILIQSWITAGKPKPDIKPLGTFESWSYVIGGILQHAGYTDFMANALEFYETADIESEGWKALCHSWYEKHQSTQILTRDILSLTQNIDSLSIYGKTDDSRLKSLGRMLSKNRNRIFDGYQINRQVIRKQSCWYLKNMNKTESGVSNELFN